MAGLIPAKELAKLNAVREAAMDLTGVVSRWSFVADGKGGQIEARVADSVAVPMEVISAKGDQLQTVAGRMDFMGSEYILSFSNLKLPYPKVRDTVACSDGNSYEIVGLMDDSSYSTTYQVFANRLN